MLCVTRADEQKHRIPLATWLPEGITGHDQDQGEWTKETCSIEARSELTDKRNILTKMSERK